MPPAVAAAITAAVLCAMYAARCYATPYARCAKCHGCGHVERRSGRGHRPCRRCKATGLRLRIGRRIANYLIARRRTYSAAERASQRRAS
jgi:hypothetical protein